MQPRSAPQVTPTNIPESPQPPGAQAPQLQPPKSLLRRLWLTEALRQTEERTGWLDDEQANRQARLHGSTFAERLQWRAWLLSRRDGLADAQSVWLQTASWTGVLVLLLAIASGLGLAWAALGPNAAGQAGVINVYRALVALLGLHALTLLVWLAALVLACVWRRPLPDSASGASDWQGSFSSLPARAFWWINQRLSRDARRAHLSPALLNVLQRAGLLKWLAGLFSHAFWLVTLTSALLALLVMLSTRRYGFVWESTLLDSATLMGITHAVGALPAWLGFPTLDAATVAASGQGVVIDAQVRQLWAMWLVGVVLVYGLLPRALLLMCCAFAWFRRVRRLTLDEDLPGYRLLRSRLMPAGESIGVSDAAPVAIPQASVAATVGHGRGCVLYAVELGNDHEWPPALPDDVSGDVHDGGRLDSGGQRRQALARLERAPAERLLVACDVRRSPDRGTMRLLVNLAQLSSQARVWLLPPPAGQPVDSVRWADWHEALATAGLIGAPEHALAWLERGDRDDASMTRDAL